MSTGLEYQEMRDWPRLTWLAVCRPGAECIRVLHGSDVEARPEWFCEAVWDGPFHEGGFDLTDLVFGSGARCRDEGVCFVSSGSTVDRLQYLVRDSAFLVSNSLACLSGVSGAEPDPRFRAYKSLFASIADGIELCEKTVPFVGGDARLVYFRNLVWDGRDLREVPKVVPERDLSAYERYVSFLQAGLAAIGRNMSSPDRAAPYRWQGMISRGYDSPAVVALATDVGLRSAISFNEGRPGVQDDGRAIASALDVEVEVVNRLGWQADGVWEPLFLSADGQGKEVLISGAGAHLQRTVLLSGNAGDYVWALEPRPSTRDLARGGRSGLSLTEFRLRCGFIHLPVPYMGMSQVADIGSISRSPEMARWNVGGSYNKPIPRRILEEKGVARELFGVAKTGASIRYVSFEDPWSPRALVELRSWIRNSTTLPLSRWRRVALAAVLSLIQLLLTTKASAPPALGRRMERTVRLLARLVQQLGASEYAFLWGMDRSSQCYRGALNVALLASS